MSSRNQESLSSPTNRRSRWHDISNDPNALAVLTARRDALTSARAGIVEDRITYLCELARGKRILDVGMVEHFLDASSSKRWLHGRLCEVAQKCVGVNTEVVKSGTKRAKRDNRLIHHISDFEIGTRRASYRHGHKRVEPVVAEIRQLSREDIG